MVLLDGRVIADERWDHGLGRVPARTLTVRSVMLRPSGDGVRAGRMELTEQLIVAPQGDPVRPWKWTSLGLGRAAAAGRSVDLDDVAVKTRDGLIGERPAGAIGFATLRGGDVVGDHSVVFAGDGERVELTHKANDRRIYARGAVRAALWARGRPPGLYGMGDVLGLND